MKVAAETGQNVNSQWFHKTPSKRKTLNPVFTERNVCRWRDVHLPFESLALRVRLFDEDTMDDDDPLGEIFVRVADLDLEDPDCPYRRFLPGDINGQRRAEAVALDKRNQDNMRAAAALETNGEIADTAAPAGATGLASPSALGGDDESLHLGPWGNVRTPTRDALNVETKSAKTKWKLAQKAVVSEPSSTFQSGGKWAGIYKAFKVRPEGMLTETELKAQREAVEQLDARKDNILDMWHELQPTVEQVRRAKLSGRSLPESLGVVRVRTWVKRSEVLATQKSTIGKTF